MATNVFKTELSALTQLKREIFNELMISYREYLGDYFNDGMNPEDYEDYLGIYIHQYTWPQYCNCGEKRGRSFKLAPLNRNNGDDLIARYACICPECGK